VHPAGFAATEERAELDRRAGVEEGGDALAGGQVATGTDALDGGLAGGVKAERACLFDFGDPSLVQGGPPRTALIAAPAILRGTRSRRAAAAAEAVPYVRLTRVPT
jgi:hypothetical protein